MGSGVKKKHTQILGYALIFYYFSPRNTLNTLTGNQCRAPSSNPRPDYKKIIARMRR